MSEYSVPLKCYQLCLKTEYADVYSEQSTVMQAYPRLVRTNARTHPWNFRGTLQQQALGKTHWG